MASKYRKSDKKKTKSTFDTILCMCVFSFALLTYGVELSVVEMWRCWCCWFYWKISLLSTIPSLASVVVFSIFDRMSICNIGFSISALYVWINYAMCHSRAIRSTVLLLLIDTAFKQFCALCTTDRFPKTEWKIEFIVLTQAHELESESESQSQTHTHI